MSLKKKASVFIAVFISLISVISTYLYISEQNLSIEKEVMARGNALCFVLSKAAEEGLITEKLSLLNKSSYIVRAEGVRLAQIFSTVWHALDGYPDNMMKIPPGHEAKVHFSGSEAPFVIKGKNIYDFYYPVKVKPFDEAPHILIGYVRIAISTQDMLEAIKKAAAKNAFFALFMSALAILILNMFIDRLVIKPVLVLRESVRKIKDGHISDVALPREGPGEIGELMKEFHSMGCQVKDREDRLQKEKEKVEEKSLQLLAAQEELVRREKLAMLGQLAGCVGHELRNPLGVMSNAVYFLEKITPDRKEAVDEYLKIIRSEIDTSQRIISDLFDFSRSKTPQREEVSAVELLRRSLERCAIPEKVLVELDLPENLSAVHVDPRQLGQVFENLVLNAAQAMPEGGSLRINAEEDRAAGLLRINLSDTGEGIAEEHMKSLFEPLFTTKKQGIGLGLVVAKGLVEINNGNIYAARGPGKGTTFTVTLPLVMTG